MATINSWIVRGVNANAQDVYQVSVQANGPRAALSLAILMRTTNAPNAARMVNDNYEPADPLPSPFSSIVGWRIEPLRMCVHANMRNA